MSELKYYVVYNDKERPYVSVFHEIGCIEGDRDYLYEEVNKNPLFCRDQKNIGYSYFLDSMKSRTCLYITDENRIVLGACSIVISHEVIIYGICVPTSSLKGTGTLLINKLKQFASILNKGVSLTATPLLQPFYEKNGFIVDPLDAIRPRIDEYDNNVLMVFRGGKNRNRKSKYQRKSKNKITKKGHVKNKSK